MDLECSFDLASHQESDRMVSKRKSIRHFRSRRTSAGRYSHHLFTQIPLSKLDVQGLIGPTDLRLMLETQTVGNHLPGWLMRNSQPATHTRPRDDGWLRRLRLPICGSISSFVIVSCIKTSCDFSSSRCWHSLWRQLGERWPNFPAAHRLIDWLIWSIRLRGLCYLDLWAVLSMAVITKRVPEFQFSAHDFNLTAAQNVNRIAWEMKETSEDKWKSGLINVIY